MQTQLDDDEIRILGVNQIGSEPGNEDTCDGNDIPWLQDEYAEEAWALWQVTYRDVVILDRNGRVAAVYNLTAHDLTNPAHFDELKQLLLATAGTLP